jgi:hypothetical protein
MGILFGATGWAGWLGWQWRRARTIGDDIKALKAQLPKAPAGEAEAPAAPAALTQQISALEKVRGLSSCASTSPTGCITSPCHLDHQSPPRRTCTTSGPSTRSPDIPALCVQASPSGCEQMKLAAVHWPVQFAAVSLCSNMLALACGLSLWFVMMAPHTSLRHNCLAHFRTAGAQGLGSRRLP